jgi:hypothetical protein
MINILEKRFSNTSFQCEQIIDNVLLVENFLSNEEIKAVIDIIENTPNQEWEVEYLGNLQRFCMQKFGRDDVENLVAEGKFEITQNWKDKNLNILKTDIHQTIYNKLSDLFLELDNGLLVTGLATIQRMQPGVELKSHTDQKTDPSIKYATIIYLNDDYIDGELFFENKGLDLKPKSGSLVIFPGTEEFEHGVRRVGNGPIRYVIVGFIKEKDFYKNNRF